MMGVWLRWRMWVRVWYAWITDADFLTSSERWITFFTISAKTTLWSYV